MNRAGDLGQGCAPRSTSYAVESSPSRSRRPPLSRVEFGSGRFDEFEINPSRPVYIVYFAIRLAIRQVYLIGLVQTRKFSADIVESPHSEPSPSSPETFKTFRFRLTCYPSTRGAILPMAIRRARRFDRPPTGSPVNFSNYSEQTCNCSE